MKRAVFLLVLSTVIYGQNHLPRDVNGWTIFSPDSDSRIAYVSQHEGNDAAAQTYAPGSPAVGNDPFLPSGQIKAYKTIAAALKAVRDLNPDWILVKRGDTLRESGGVKNGMSIAKPFLLSAYGPGNERPLFKTGAAGGINVCCKNASCFAIAGLSFYAQTRDRDSPEFLSDSGSAGFNIYTGDTYTMQGILIEDCMFRFYNGNVIQGPGTISDVVIRRNVITDNYSANSHSQGLYTDNASLLLEENVFDHNGWYKQSVNSDNSQAEGQATIFNHNTYFSGSHNVTFRNNIFLRASSIGNKWTANNGPASAHDITVENNLYVEGEIGISMGGNVAGPYRFRNIRIADNVMLDIGRARPTRRTLGWGLEIQEWDSGTVTSNLFLHNTSDTVDNVYALDVHGGGGTRNVSIADNIIYGLKTGGTLVYFEDTLSGIAFDRNAVQSRDIPARLMNAAGLSGISFSGNAYFSTRPAAQWFAVGTANTDLAGWTARSGETGATGTAVAYPDPSRTVERYNATLGKPGTFTSFITEVRAQSKSNWRREYTAATINDWIRAGFGIPPAAARFQPAPQRRNASSPSVNGTMRVYSINGRAVGRYGPGQGVAANLPAGVYLIGTGAKMEIRLMNCKRFGNQVSSGK
jgi:hypothetical protein